MSGAREHEGNRGFYTGIVDQRAGGWHVTRFHLTLDRRLKTLWSRTRASSKWNCLKHVQTWRRRIILVLVLGQRSCGRFIFGAFGSKVCPCLTTEFVDACGSKHVHFQVPNFDPPPGLQMRHRPLETRPNLRSWDESLARGKRQNHSVDESGTGHWSNRSVSGPKNLQMRVKPSQGSQFCLDLTCTICQIVEVTASANGAGEPQAQCPNSLF